MGDAPGWYSLIRAAKYLGVAPWTLEQQPITWMERALVAEGAEHEARPKPKEPKGKGKRAR